VGGYVAVAPPDRALVSLTGVRGGPGDDSAPYGDRAEPDAELWGRPVPTDEGGFREVFTRHHDAVYNFAFRRTASWSVAEDVTQTTFAALWRRAVRRKVEPLRLDSARPLLLAMARGECSNALRSGRRHLRVVEVVTRDQRPTAEADAATWVEAEATMGEIRRLLGALPARHREVIELVAWAELSLTEVATILDIPVGTVKSRLSRARARLMALGGASLLGRHPEGERS
jgi:RNA polymerase sigma-70 factor, ECF subfamily